MIQAVNDNLVADDIIRIIGKKRTKEKKLRTFDSKLAYLKPPKMMKMKAENQKILDMISKEGKRDPYDIYSFLRSKGLRASEDDARFYSILVKSVFYNVKINIGDILGGKRFKATFINSQSYKDTSKVFTNDRLYWIQETYSSLKNTDLLKFVKFEGISISLQTIATVQEKEYAKAYIQDYKSDFCFIGSKMLESEVVKNFLTNPKNFISLAGGSVDNFIYNGKQYVSYKTKTGIVLCYDQEKYTKAEDLIAANNETLYIESKKDLKSGIKVITLIDKTSCFISQNFKIVDFAPGVVMFNNQMPYAFLLKLDLDMLQYEEYLYNKYKENIEAKKKIDSIGDYVFTENLVTWETFDLLVNFIIVEYATRFKSDVSSNLGRKINTFIQQWPDIKSIFDNAKKVCLQSCRFLLKFFDSFQSKINLDVVSALLKQSNIALNYQKTLSESKLVEKLEDYIKENKLEKTCITVYNCIQNNCAKLNDLLSITNKVLLKFTRLESDNLVESLRGAGIGIANVLLYGTEDTQLMNEIRTPSLFLGNLVGGNIDSALAAVGSFNKKISNVLKDMKDSNQILFKMAGIPDDDAIVPGLLYIMKTIGGIATELTDESSKLIPVFKEWIESNFKSIIEKQPKYKPIITVVGKSVLLNNNNYEGVSYLLNKDDKIFLLPLIDNFKAYAKAKKLELELKNAQVDLKINDMKQNIAEDIVIDDENNPPGSVTNAENGNRLNAIKGFTKEALAKFGGSTFDNLDINKSITITSQTLQAFRNRGVADEYLFEYLVGRKINKVGSYKDIPENDAIDLALLTFKKYLEPSLIKGVSDDQIRLKIKETFYGDQKKKSSK